MYLPGGSEDGKTHSDAGSDVDPGKWTDTVEHVHPTTVLGVEADLWLPGGDIWWSFGLHLCLLFSSLVVSGCLPLLESLDFLL